MAIIALYDLEITEHQYNQVVKDPESQGVGAPDGRIFHVASHTSGWWLICDIWESEEKLNEFSEVLVPAFTAIGVEETQPTIHPVHNMIGR